MTRVVAIILHAVPGASAGPLEQGVRGDAGGEREATGRSPGGGRRDRHGRGRRRRRTALRRRDSGTRGPATPAPGLVVLGSGSVPLATRADARRSRGGRGDRRSGAGQQPLLGRRPGRSRPPCRWPRCPISRRTTGCPAGSRSRAMRVADLAGRWRLQVDLDSPLDGLLAGLAGGRRRGPGAAAPDPFTRVRAAMPNACGRWRGIPSAELLVAGRTSARSLRWLERSTRSRSRVLVEERGMRTAPHGPASAPVHRRPAARARWPAGARNAPRRARRRCRDRQPGAPGTPTRQRRIRRGRPRRTASPAISSSTSRSSTPGSAT